MEFPVPVFKIDTEPKQVNDNKELEAAIRDGWSISYVPKEFPRYLYKLGENPKIVADANEKTLALADGWQIEAIAAPVAKSPTAPASADHLDTLTERFEQLRVDVQQQIQELRELLDGKQDKKKPAA